MKQAYLWIVILTIVAIVASLYLIPSNQELGLILLRSSKDSKAEQIYTGLYESGEMSPEVVHELGVIYEKKGELQKAIKITQEYAKHHPEDSDVLKKLSQLYYLNMQFDEYDQTLIKMHASKAKLDIGDLHELAGYYNKKNEPEQEAAILKEIVNTGKADEGDYVELANIYAKMKNFEQAASYLKDRREFFTGKTNLDLLLYELWVNVQIGKTEGAKITKLIADFLIKKNDPRQTYYAMGLYKDRYPEFALQLVELLQSEISKYPSLQTPALAIFWDHVELRESVYRKLPDLENYAATDKDMLFFIFNIYLTREDDQRLLELIQNSPVQNLGERSIIDLVLNSMIRDKPKLSSAMQESLGLSYLQDHPLVELALEMGMQESDAKEKFDQYLDKHHLTPTDELFLIKLAAVAHFDDEIEYLGRRLAPFSGMQESDLVEIAQAFAAMKEPEALYSILEGPMQDRMAVVGITSPKINFGCSEVSSPCCLMGLDKGTPSSQTMASIILPADQNQEEVKPIAAATNQAIGAALALLDIALHKSKEAFDWMQQKKTMKETTLKAYFEVAKENKEYPLDLYIAKRLQNEYPSFHSESSYALALVQVGKAENGIAILRQLHEKHPSDSQIEQNYFSALILASKKEEKYHRELASLMHSMEQKGIHSRTLLRDFGYTYIETLRDYRKAQKIFMRLSENSSSNSSDLQTLIYLWGPNPTAAQQQWIVNRAYASKDDELQDWLGYLNYIGRFCNSIELFQKRQAKLPIEPKLYFSYMQALAYEKHREELKHAVYKLFPVLQERKQLEELSIYAEEAEYPEIRMAIWEKITEYFPDDPLAWQNLAKAQFDSHAYQVARPSLENFFALSSTNNPKLYESLFQYAETLRKQRFFQAARHYYRLTLHEIKCAKELTARMSEIASYCNYQLWQENMLLTSKKNALCSAQKYFELSGRDSNAAATYANMLMDVGYLSKASRFLNSVFKRTSLKSYGKRDKVARPSRP